MKRYKSGRTLANAKFRSFALGILHLSQWREIRPDLDSFDLLRALIGVSNVASVPDWPQRGWWIS
jgi:hypothetical protein